jgi:predicted Kef-type K+ transport protein
MRRRQHIYEKTPHEIAQERLAWISVAPLFVSCTLYTFVGTWQPALSIELLQVIAGIGIACLLFTVMIVFMGAGRAARQSLQKHETISEKNPESEKSPDTLIWQSLSSASFLVALISLLCLSLTGGDLSSMFTIMFGTSLSVSSAVALLTRFLANRQQTRTELMRKNDGVMVDQDLAAENKDAGVQIPKRYKIGDDGEIIELQKPRKRSKNPHQR